MLTHADARRARTLQRGDYDFNVLEQGAQHRTLKSPGTSACGLKVLVHAALRY
jgi:hypothetical protein